MIAGESESPIRNVTIRNAAFRWERQGGLIPDCLDEQPSRRGVYPHAVPTVYLRAGENIALRDNVRFEIDDSMKPYILDTVISE